MNKPVMFIRVSIERNLNASLPFRQAALKINFTYPGQVLAYFVFFLVARWLDRALTHRASENEELLA